MALAAFADGWLWRLQGDLCESLRVRLELLVEDALSWQEEQRQGGDDAAAAGGEGGEAQQHPLLQRGGAALARAHVEGLPRRVQLPALVRRSSLSWDRGRDVALTRLHAGKAG